jgi:hypothetical protein
MPYNLRLAISLAALAILAPTNPVQSQEAQRSTGTRTGTATAAPIAPAEYLGFPVGADFKLAAWDSISSYMSHLAKVSPAARVDTLGRTTQDRPFLAVVITSPENMQRIEEIRRSQARLADPRKLAEGELETLLDSHPAVVAITHNIHSTEIASSQGVMELAYSLITEPEMLEALRDVVVVLVPSVNPDGQQMVVDWYSRTLGTPYEGSRMPWLYHYYVGHDNNRDFYMLTQVESQMVNDLLYGTWFPEVVYDVHQMGNRGARFFIPPFDDPVNPNLDPLVVRTISLFGLQVSADLEAAGKAGVLNGERFDLWWHGGLRSVPARHNMVGILSESASARIASPIFQEPGQVDRQSERGNNYPNPWPGGWWRIRDIIDYQVIASRSIIGLAARWRRPLISNYVEIGRRAIDAGRNEPPFAYIIPSQQRDVGSAVAMLRTIRRGGAEIHRAVAPFEADGIAYSAGDWVVLMAQPYRAHAKDLLEPQVYPDRRLYPGGPPDTPYDAAGWTLPFQMGVKAVGVKSPLEAELQLETDVIRPPVGTVAGSGPAFAVENVTNAANLAIHRTVERGGRVTLLSQPAEVGGRTWPTGSAVLSGPGVRQTLEELAESHGLSAASVSGQFTGHSLSGFRVGLYQPWTASMDEGWTRWVFESWELPYQTLHDAEIQAGGLEQRYDVIVLPDVESRSLIEGRAPGTVPPQFAGGLGDSGVSALRDFVKAGGTLICLDSSSGFAIQELGLAVADARPSPSERRSGEAFYAPGSIMAVNIDVNHPLAFGMPETGAVYYNNSPLFQVEEGASGVTVVASYPETSQLMSGYVLNADFMNGKAALVEASYGAGRAILFGFRPQYRGQSHETFKILFNAVYRGATTQAQPQEF